MTTTQAPALRIRCRLSELMGREKMRIADVARATGLNRNMVTLLYYERAREVDLLEVQKICQLFDCQVGDLFQLVEEPPARKPAKRTARISKAER